MKFRDCFKLIKEDSRRLGKNPYLIFFTWFTSYSSMITFWLRIGSWLHTKKNPVAKFNCHICKIIYRFCELTTGIQVPIGTKIKGGVRFFHYNCIIIAWEAIIGENCSIHQGVSIGRSFAGNKAGVPTLEDHVVVFPGAKIIGNVHIGSHAVIGANAVVIQDVPSYTVVAGVPAKIISQDSKKCFDEKWRRSFDF